MSTHRYIDRICYAVLALVLALTLVFVNGESLGIQPVKAAMGYETRLFDTSRVHALDIIMDDWEGFLSHCTDEEYVSCSVRIDNEAYKNVGLRAKGNTSLSQVKNYGNDRYSFKIEFDHYDSAKSYYGLDKLCLNNIIQDNTYMKDYLCYQLMGDFGVSAPLCSFVYITVNGEDWGLYLAVEGVEDAFMARNYRSSGNLYKPDSISMGGGGPGNGRAFKMEGWKEQDEAAQEEGSSPAGDGQDAPPSGGFPDGRPSENPAEPPSADGDTPAPSQDGSSQESPFGPAGRQKAFSRGMRENGEDGFPGGGFPGRMGSSDVSLIYSDDSYDSYPNIFENVKTDITDSDKDRLIASLKALGENSSIASVVDIEQVIRYFVVHNFVLNFDSYTGTMIHNYYLYEEAGQLAMIPWDYNLAFGGFEASASAQSLVNYPIDSPVSGGSIESRPMLAWIFADPQYTELYHEYFSEFIAEQFESGAFSEGIDAVKAMISPYVERDPTKFCSFEEFETGIDTLKSFCLLRAESIRGQLDGRIASTLEGQQAQENFVSAEGIAIADMGSMNMGGRGGMGGPSQMPFSLPEGFGFQNMPTPPEGFPGSAGDSGQPPENPGAANTSAPASEGSAPGGTEPSEGGARPEGAPAPPEGGDFPASAPT